MNRPLIVGIVGAVIVLAAIILTFFIDREPDRPVPDASTAPAAGASGAGDTAAVAPGPSDAPAGASGPETGDRADTAVSASPPGASQTPPSSLPPPAAAGPVSPSFDIVRVNPQGDTVIAGRAEPDSTVTVRLGDKVIGEAVADKRGEWVVVPQEPLPPGSHELTVSSLLPDGRVLRSDRSVVLLVPEAGRDIAGRPAGDGQAPLALAVPGREGGAPIVLQAPGGVSVGGLSLDAIDYGPGGARLSLSGRAPPGARVRVYLDNDFIGEATADERGIWSLSPDSDLPAGLYSLRVDRVDGDGKVLARLELPFSRAAPFTDLADGTVVLVQPGNTLWRLARRAYGGGLRYTTIFEANRDQIRDPDLIYPGQIFVLPKVN